METIGIIGAMQGLYGPDGEFHVSWAGSDSRSGMNTLLITGDSASKALCLNPQTVKPSPSPQPLNPQPQIPDLQP